MSERFNPAESQPRDHAGLERAAAERLKRLERTQDSQEKPPPRAERVEAAREQLAHIQEAPPAAEKAPAAEPAAPRGILTQAANYRATMASLRHRLRPASRSFSRFIHAPAVERTSEVVGATVLRPSVSLGATTTAVLLTGFIYFYARHQGFLLRGSEIWLTLLLGAAAGLIIELASRLLRRLGTA